MVQSDVVFAVQTDQPTLQETRIVYVSEWDGKEEIYVMSSDGSHVQRLTTTVQGTELHSTQGSVRATRALRVLIGRYAV